MELKQLFVTLENDYIEKTKKDAREAFLAMTGEEDKSTLQYEDLVGKVEIVEENLKDGTITLGIKMDGLGYVHMELEVNNNFLLSMTNFIIKKMNKFRNLMESL